MSVVSYQLVPKNIEYTPFFLRVSVLLWRRQDLYLAVWRYVTCYTKIVNF